MKDQITFLIIASEFKGNEFIKACKEAGCRVFVVISKFLENKPWIRSHIDELFFVEAEKDQQWNMEDVIAGMAHVMRKNKIDRIVAMDDFDVEKAAELREHFRIPGMGQTTFRHFRDKLAMRIQAQDGGIPVPAFSGLFNDQAIEAYCDSVEAPWVVKPRFKASATGIKKVHSKQELYEHFEVLGEDRHNYLIEQFRPGHVYHADSLSFRGKQVFTSVGQYLDTPMEVAHGGGIFRTHTIKPNTKEDKAIKKLNVAVMDCFGMQDSASHTEFIQDKETGDFVFLETASRVGGAHIAEMTEAAYGVNLWEEWAKLDCNETRKVQVAKINQGLCRDYCFLGECGASGLCWF